MIEDYKETTPIKIENVGEEFMLWAEKCWGLDKLIKQGLDDYSMDEACPYTYMRKVFVDKINQLSKDK